LFAEGGTLGPDRRVFAHQTLFGKLGEVPGSVRGQRYLAENSGAGWELFDLWADPSQKRDLAEAEPERLHAMVEEYRAWFRSVTAGGVEPPPIPVGYPGYKTQTLIVPDAIPEGELVYADEHGWATDWLTNWASTEDRIIFEIDVRTPGAYECVLLYYCEPEDVGALLALESAGDRVMARLENAHAPDFIELPNNHMEYTPLVREWGRLTLGTLHLQKGEQQLVLRADQIPGKVAGEVRALEISFTGETPPAQ
jgi:hypothetical protein